MVADSADVAARRTSRARVPPRVFVSYSHDSEAHRARALALANQLREDGLEATIDRHEPLPAQGWPRWMTQQLKRADFVLCVCTETYRRRFEGEEEPGVGQGVTWEGLIAQQLLYDTRRRRKQRFVPIVFEVAAKDSIPLALQPFTCFEYPDEYEALYEALTGAGVPVPAVGSPRVPSERESISEGLPDLAGDPDTRARLERQIRMLDLQSDRRLWIAVAVLAIGGAFAIGEQLVPQPPQPMIRLGITPKDAIVLVNDGDGRATLDRKSFAVWVDRQPVPDWPTFLERLGIYQQAEKYGWPEALGPGKRKSILKVRGVEGGLSAYAERMAFEYCYCSDRGDCRVATSKGLIQDTRAGACPQSERFALSGE